MNDPYAYTDISTLLPGIAPVGIYEDGEYDRIDILDECNNALAQAGYVTTPEQEDTLA